jgi:hypothetical protein
VKIDTEIERNHGRFLSKVPPKAPPYPSFRASSLPSFLPSSGRRRRRFRRRRRRKRLNESTEGCRKKKGDGTESN